MFNQSKFAIVAMAAAACFTIAACQPAAEAPTSMDLPMTTESQEARTHFVAGLDALDMADALTAHQSFAQAIAADPNFALGHLYVGLSGPSTEDFAAGLAAANEHAAGASRGEQLLIESWQHAFDNDVEAQLASTTALTELHPDSARAWLAQATVLEGMNRVTDARAALDRAIEIAPNSVAAQMQAGNDYLNLAPKDFTRAAGYFQRAIELAPDASNPYDLLGDAHRAQNDLQAARTDYTSAAERAPEQGSPLQQRGHVNSFLGNYAEARADYDRAAELENTRGSNVGPFFAVFRAYVNLYENNHAAAISELRGQLTQASASTAAGKADLQANILISIAQIATHSGDYAAATAALDELAAVTSQQAAAIGNADFQRAQEANVIYNRGLLAARRGQGDAVRTLAAQFQSIVEPDPNPRKLEPMHEVLGMAAYYRRDYATAATELAQANPNDMYVKYYLAVSQLESGQAEAGTAALREIAVYNFNDPRWAMIRADVLERVSRAA